MVQEVEERGVSLGGANLYTDVCDPFRDFTMRPRTIIEPFKIKQVEPIRMTTPEQRLDILRAAKWNLFKVDAEDVIIDLLTDSGTGSMSSTQWAAMMDGDEAYAGSRSWKRFWDAVHTFSGFTNIAPTHQGRAAERILFQCMDLKGKYVLSNTLFDTTHANCEAAGGLPVNIPIREALQPSVYHPFKGNIDLRELERRLKDHAKDVACVVITATNNTGGGQPVALANIQGASKLCREHGVPIFLDACRVAENAYFVQQRESGRRGARVSALVRAAFDCVDGATFSAKKDGMANIGGFLAVRDADLFERIQQVLILTEGYVTYGGLAGRDLEAIAVGLQEVVQEPYLEYRIRSTQYLGDGLSRAGLPIVQPPGGHAVYIDAGTFLPHVPKAAFPGHTVAAAFYIEGGIRMVECGSLMFGGRDINTGEERVAALELCRAAIPRRTYTQAHVDYIIEVANVLCAKARLLRGFRILKEPAQLRHFSAELEPVDKPAGAHNDSAAAEAAAASLQKHTGSAEPKLAFLQGRDSARIPDSVEVDDVADAGHAKGLA